MLIQSSVQWSFLGSTEECDWPHFGLSFFVYVALGSWTQVTLDESEELPAVALCRDVRTKLCHLQLQSSCF